MNERVRFRTPSVTVHLVSLPPSVVSQLIVASISCTHRRSLGSVHRVRTLGPRYGLEEEGSTRQGVDSFAVLLQQLAVDARFKARKVESSRMRIEVLVLMLVEGRVGRGAIALEGSSLRLWLRTLYTQKAGLAF